MNYFYQSGSKICFRFNVGSFKAISLSCLLVAISCQLFLGQNAYAQDCGYAPGLGCSNTNYNNFGANSNNDPSTIEYDNFVSAFHSTIVRSYSGEFKAWGEQMASNGTGNLLVPTTINSSNYPGLTGTVLKAAVITSSVQQAQSVVLTTTGLFAWGNVGRLFSSSIKNNASFGALSINSLNSTYDLPAGINPADVKMMFATHQTLAIVTCNGQAWVLSQIGHNRGNGNTGNETTWARVSTAANTPLQNVIAVRGCRSGLIALTSDNKIYTWGTNTYRGTTGSGNVKQARTFATEMVKPAAAGTIKMIGANAQGNSESNISYYVLDINGNLFALGDNGYRQLGIWNESASVTWVRPKYPNGSNNGAGSDMEDILWFSPNEHCGLGYAAVNVINADKEIWNWGSNSGTMLGRTPTSSSNSVVTSGSSANILHPGRPSSTMVPPSQKIICVETGGHTTMIAKMCEENFGYVGHAIRGSAATVTSNDETYYNNFVYQANVQICGATTVPEINITGTPIIGANNHICNTSSIVLSTSPSGGTLSLVSGPGTLSGNTLTFTGTGVVEVSYSVVVSECSTVPTTVTRSFQTEGCTVYEVSGLIWIDRNADALIGTGEPGTNTSNANNTGLWANLINDAGEVIASQPVNMNGAYSLSTLENGTYSVLITNTQIGVGANVASITNSQKTLPAGWVYTGTNVNNSNPNTNPANSITGIVVNNANAGGNNFGIRGTLSISGTVFYDTTGLTGNGNVDGTPINTIGSTPLYVSLHDATGVIGSQAVQSNGTYFFNNIEPNKTFISVLGLSSTTGSASPFAGSGTNGWASIGESCCNGTGSDGTPDGAINISLETSSVTNANFGIQQPPTADPKFYEVANAAFSVNIPAGFNHISGYKAIAMNSSALSGIYATGGSISGSDPEDCAAAASCNGLGIGTVSTFNIETIRSNTRLFYDFGGSVGIDEIIVSSGPVNLYNFDASKMVIYGEIGQGDLGNEFGFTYTLTDNAGIRSTPALYQILTIEPLPLTLLDFNGHAQSGKSVLNWVTIQEKNVSHFNVYHSVNGSQWNRIGTVEALNNEHKNNYSFEDLIPENGNNFYRLGIEDLDATVEYSKVVNVEHKGLKADLVVAPNPVRETLNITLNSHQNDAQVDIVISDIKGRIVSASNHTGVKEIQIDMSSFNAGIYSVQVKVGEEFFTQKVTKK